MSPRLAATGAALLALAFAPAAHAAKQTQIGTGFAPDVAVDSSGTAHIAWVEATPDGARPVHYCKFNRNALACEKSVAIPVPLDSIGQNAVHVFTPSDGRVLILAGRCCDTDTAGSYLLESTDGGETFAAPRRIGTLDPTGGALFANESVYGITTGGENFQRMPLAGPVPATPTALNAGFPIPTYGGVGIDGGRAIKVSADGTNASFHVQNGAGDANDATTWAGPTPLTPAANETKIASGSAGTVLLSRVANGTPPNLYAQKWNGSGFGAPVPIAPSVDPIFYDLRTDPSGRFTALWVENALTPNEVRFSQSKDGTTWSAPTTILRAPNVDSLFSTKVSTAADGQGFGVWDSNNNNGPILVAPLDALPDLTGNAGTPSTVATTTVGGVQIGLIAPTSCVNPGDKVALRVTSKIKKKLSPTKRVKITLATFSVDKKKVKDKKAAFKGIFATTGFKAASKHPLKAVVKLKPIKGKAKIKDKTLKGTLTMCG